MKKLLFTIALILPLLTFSQTLLENKDLISTDIKKVVTTEEEYNYLTSGYKLSLDNGTGVKLGYKLEKIKELTVTNYKFEYFKFIKSDENQTKAILFITTKVKSGKDDKVEYFCLPFNDAKLITRFFYQADSMGITIGALFKEVLFAVLSESASYRYNYVK